MSAILEEKKKKSSQPEKMGNRHKKSILGGDVAARSVADGDEGCVL